MKHEPHLNNPMQFIFLFFMRLLNIHSHASAPKCVFTDVLLLPLRSPTSLIPFIEIRVACRLRSPAPTAPSIARPA